MSNLANLIWVRNDLRLSDNPALYAAQADTCFVLFTLDGLEGEHLGAASKVFLHHALAAFRDELYQKYKVQLLIRKSFKQAVDELKAVSTIAKVSWNRSYEPHILQRDLAIETWLKKSGIASAIYPGSVLCEPWELKNKSAQHFKVFTPFYRSFLNHVRPLSPLAAPIRLQPALIENFKLGQLEDLQLLPQKTRWDIPLIKTWSISETAAHQLLDSFLQSKILFYPEHRDIPAESGTSRLSCYLHFGLISARSIWAQCQNQLGPSTDAFLRQLIWREFAIYSLFHQPSMNCEPIKKQFKDFPWDEQSPHLEAWQRGCTGYPIIDAGMRELWQTGWMHNRVRMITGSFLVKNLHINWVRGAEWFWQTLIDADLANNSMGWQWVAGCGIDPSPYFRIFNPMLQSEKFDPNGLYIKHWLPELKHLPTDWVHKPWDAPASILEKAGLLLGKTYPRPIVDFAHSRQEALMFYDRIKAQD